MSKTKTTGGAKSIKSEGADDGVPIKYLIAVRDFTGGEVTLEEMAEQRSATKSEA